MTTDNHTRYLKPGRSTTVFNTAVAALARAGVSMLGSRELRVRGRRSGEWRTTPVNLLVVDGQRYLVAPRGQTQWVRNLRVAGEGYLLVGRKRERFAARELSDDEKEPILRAWSVESVSQPTRTAMSILPDVRSIVWSLSVCSTRQAG